MVASVVPMTEFLEPDWVSDTVDDPETTLVAVMGGYRNSVKHAKNLDWSHPLWQGGPNGHGSSLEKIWFLDERFSVHAVEMGDYYFVKERMIVAGEPFFVFTLMSCDLSRAIEWARILNHRAALGVDLRPRELYSTVYGRRAAGHDA